MRIKFHRIENTRVEPAFKINRKIQADEVFLIDETGEAVGKMSFEKALQMAEDARLDLVEVNPKANPIVVKIANFGQLKYEKEKMERKQKVQQKKVEMKNIRLSFRISEHDSNFRLKQAEKFLAKENKTKIEMILRGREKQHVSKGMDVIRGFVDKLQNNPDLKVEIEQPLTKQGGRLTIILINKK